MLYTLYFSFNDGVTWSRAPTSFRHLHHQMKMIRHQAPGENIAIRLKMAFDLLQEEKIIFPFVKNGLPVIALVVNIVYAVGFEMHMRNI